MRRAKFSTLALAALVLLVGSCSSGDAESSQPTDDASTTSASVNAEPDRSAGGGRWAGKVEGTDAFVAIVSDGEATTAYLCDGAAISSWFKTDAGAEMQAESGGIEVDAARDSDDWTGTVTLPDGSSKAFTASPSDDEVLFRAEGEDDDGAWLGGWIVLGDEQRGSLVLRTSTSTTQTSPTLEPSTLTLSGATTTSTSLVVQPVSPLKLPTGSTTATTSWTASGRVTRSGTGVGGLTVRFSRSDGSVLGSARTSTDGSYRLAMTVPSSPIVVNGAVLDSSGRVLPLASPVQVTTVPNGASTVNLALT